jgi:heterodisulfide reductase subunit A-like polyferredoxin
MAYVISAEKCTGCNQCLEECPLAAISEDAQGKYRIDPEICTDCGSCADICLEEAIRGL